MAKCRLGIATCDDSCMCKNPKFNNWVSIKEPKKYKKRVKKKKENKSKSDNWRSLLEYRLND